ncbi:MAG: ABC transporter ATP-binding protein [Deltaproteobacteria bacterium]|nr:MAG: ABC transporter ATP-binding protein [Deltaproteobacteria bacterium]
MERAVVLEATELKKSYGSFEAVKGINFQVHAQECYGFLGPNGAGKTSTMKMMYGASTITSGSIRVLGMDVQQELRAIKRRLGVVPQELNLDDELPVIENLQVYGRYFNLGWKESGLRAERLLEQMQLSEKRDEKVQALSGGMKRRLLIARALVSQPDLLILDEPTVGLDPQARHLLWDILHDLKRQGMTLLLTTHYMDEAEQLCDRLVVMHEGSIIAEDSPQSLIQKHVGKEVLEVTSESYDTMDVVNAAEGSISGWEKAGERLLLYSPDAEATLGVLREASIPLSRVLMRRATLEDVFLQLTGRKLGNG